MQCNAMRPPLLRHKILELLRQEGYYGLNIAQVCRMMNGRDKKDIDGCIEAVNTQQTVNYDGTGGIYDNCGHCSIQYPQVQRNLYTLERRGFLRSHYGWHYDHKRSGRTVKDRMRMFYIHSPLKRWLPKP